MKSRRHRAIDKANKISNNIGKLKDMAFKKRVVKIGKTLTLKRYKMVK